MSKIALLSQSLVEHHGLSQAKAIEFVSSMFSIIRDRILTEKIVKVKGLGTFKLAEMNARESVDVNTGERITIEGRYKLSFTPENAVRDRINSPFCQFESIDLDGDFDFSAIDEAYAAETTEETNEAPELQEPAAPEEQVSPEEPETSPEPAEYATPVEQPEPAPTAESLTPIEPAEEPEPVEETPTTSEESTESYEPSESSAISDLSASSPREMRSPYCEELINEELEHSRRIITMLKWLLTLVVLLLVCVGLVFAYQMGKNSSRHVGQDSPDKPVVIEEAEERDTQEVAEDTLRLKTVEPEKPATAEQEQKPANPEIPSQDEYNKDARIRTGAYAILGIDTVVTVQEGQTFKGICRAYLGVGMECYVEAVNGGITSVEPGQNIKIPKIKLKKLLNKN